MSTRGCRSRWLRHRHRGRQTNSPLVHGAGGSMVSLQPCLLDNPMECAKLIDLALREFGRLDVVFNLAGRAHFGELENVSDEDWDAARAMRST
jgi:NAD(P)-dependent dehydrogenase (short-subunit alcohol dehydrogenase family)